jgi:hypothetical protein
MFGWRLDQARKYEILVAVLNEQVRLFHQPSPIYFGASSHRRQPLGNEMYRQAADADDQDKQERQRQA